MPSPQPPEIAHPTSFAADNAFSDGGRTDMLSVSGDPSSGYAASLTINVSS